MKLHLVTTQEVEKAPTTRVTDSTSSYWLFIFLPAKIVYEEPFKYNRKFPSFVEALEKMKH
jgi:hypothetical protein